MSDQIPVHGVVMFYTSSAALRAEKIMRQDGLPVKLIPTPREFSSDCGVALRFDWRWEQRARALLQSANVEIAAIRALE